MATSRPGSWTAGGRNSIALKMPKIEILSPIPAAKVPMAIPEKPGRLNTDRRAYRMGPDPDL